MNPLKKSIFIIAAIFLMFFIACGGGDKPSSPLPNPTPSPTPNPTPNPKDDDKTGQEIQFLINDIAPDAALAGATVTISYSGPNETPEIIWSGMTITGTPVTGGTDKKIAFQVPTGGESGPLYLKKGDSASNAVWFSLSATSVMTPRPEDIVTDELGTQIAVNQVLISLHDDKNTYAEAERLAELVDGEIVGQITLMSAYQLLLKTKTLAELEEAINTLEADSSVKYAVENIMLQRDAVNWSDDPTINENQRSSNSVEEGVNEYISNVRNNESGKISPALTRVGILEAAVDFTQKDFANYASINTWDVNNNNMIMAAFNNTVLSAKSGSVDVEDTKERERNEHGTNVTGVISATLGNGGMAGLLQAVSEAKGMFHVTVAGGPGWSLDQFSATDTMVNNNYQVINWSFGQHKEGAKTYNGVDVTNNIINSDTFERNYEAAVDLINRISEKNVVIIASAGNGNTDAGDTNFRTPTSIKSDNIIVVGAHNIAGTGRDRDHSKSNYGERVDISAAGDTIRNYRSKANEECKWDSEGNNECVVNGTSFAAPLVTATVALMLSIDPDLEPKEIKGILRKTAWPVENNTFPTYKGTDDVFTRPIAPAEVGKYNKLNEGARLNVYGAIEYVLEKKKGNVLVPYVIDMINDQMLIPVTAAIVNAGLKVGTVTYENHDTIPSGRVLSQSPEGGTYAAPGSSINLVISKGHATDSDVTVPDVTGMTEAGAITAITAAGFTIGTVTYENHDTIPSGRVISQSPAAGTSVVQGTTITLRVSSGPMDANSIPIRTAADLDNIRNNLAGSFYLTADISLASYENWEPIGTSSAPFTGKMNGNGYKISDLKIYSSYSNCIGLFGYAENSTLTNLVLENVYISGTTSYSYGTYAGGIVGYATNTIIANSHSSGNISSSYHAGGIAGVAKSSNITNSYSIVNVSRVQDSAGGIVGIVLDNTTINNSYSMGRISSSYSAGGIAGYVVNSNITNSYSKGNVSSGSPSDPVLAGGIAGSATSTIITNSYSMGDISSSYSGSSTSASLAGGITGDASNTTITNSYSTGNISSSGYSPSTNTGGIAGSASSSTTITNSYSTGNISSSGYAGGIAGRTIIVTITNCAAINKTINSRYNSSYASRISISSSVNSSISNNFALETMTATGAEFNTDPTYHGISKTDAQLRTRSTYEDATYGDGDGGLGWKFGNDDENPWKMPPAGSDYPYPILYWQ